jgi:lycopene cyclase domain-containing protein
MTINEHWYYLLINLGCISIPFIFSFHPKIQFYKHWKAFLIGELVMMLVFIPWDMQFTSMGIWGFRDRFLSGIFLGNLPVEEWMFFFCIPYACLYTYHCFSIFTEGKRIPGIFEVLPWFFVALCIGVAIFYYQHLYTLVAHILCAALLLFHLLILRKPYLSVFLLTFCILLVPFIISNGMLTGITFWEYPFINLFPEQIDEQIVWYDNKHTLGVRLFTMPVDDLSYGLTMLLLVATVYEAVKSEAKVVASVLEEQH